EGCAQPDRSRVSFFFSSRRRHTRWPRDWSSDVCSSDLTPAFLWPLALEAVLSGTLWGGHRKAGVGSSHIAGTAAMPKEQRTSTEIGRASCRERVTIPTPGEQGEKRRKQIRDVQCSESTI